MRQRRSVRLSRDRREFGEALEPHRGHAGHAGRAAGRRESDHSSGKSRRAISGGTSSLVLPAAVDDETAMPESVQADARTVASTGQPGQFLDRRIGSAGELQDGRRDRQAELRPDSQADVLGGRLEDPNRRLARRDPQSGSRSSRHREDSFDPIGQRTLDDVCAAGLDGELDGRRLDHEAEAAELSA